MRSPVRLVVALALVTCATGCSTPDLTSGGAAVDASPDPPGKGCVDKGHVTGEGGGSFGGAWISNDDLIEYAMNDLRNKTAERGGNYVQHDPPSLGDGDGTTTTATVSGEAFFCP